MHSSRMHTVCCSGRLAGVRGDGGLSQGWRLPGRVYAGEGAGPDPGFPIEGGTIPQGVECQHTNLPDFPQNCMILRKFWSMGGGVWRVSARGCLLGGVSA